jgi:hypothetical protein
MITVKNLPKTRFDCYFLGFPFLNKRTAWIQDYWAIYMNGRLGGQPRVENPWLVLVLTG